MLARKVLLSGAGLALGFLLVEGLLRATRLDLLALGDPFREHDSPSIQALVPDAFLQWRGRAHHRAPWIAGGLNARGFRGPLPKPRKRAGVLRVAVLGDSCTFGVVRRRRFMTARLTPYPELLQELRDGGSGGNRFEVINYGVIGYTSYHGLRLLRSEVLNDHPDLVVIRFGWNDHVASPLGRSYASPRREWIERLEASGYRSRFLGLLLYRGIPQAQIDSSRWVLSASPTTWVTPEDYAFHLSRMIELARAHGARAILLDAPAAPLGPELLAMKRILAETGYESFEALLDAHARYEAITARVAEEAGVPFVRTAPPPAGEATYFSGFDLMHPDAGGHARIAAILHEAVLASLGPAQGE
jgi:lysophospholipase L1-like esterase